MFDQTILSEVERLAYLYLTTKEISTVTGIDRMELQDEDSEIGRAVNKGRLLRKAEYNQSVINLSKQMSSPAMAIESKIAEQSQLNEFK